MKQQNTFICEVCHQEHPIDERVWIEGSVSDSEITICQNCYNGYYTCCERCDGLIRYDDAVYFGDDNEFSMVMTNDTSALSLKLIRMVKTVITPTILLIWQMKIVAVFIANVTDH